MAVDASRNPVSIHRSPGRDADGTHAAQLPGDHTPTAVLGDEGHDTTALIAAVEARGAEVVIPSKANWVEPRDHDPVMYKEWNNVGRCVNMLNQYRRVATRYGKTARNFQGTVLFAAKTI